LCNWLTDDGLLFAGHAEAVEQMDARFQRVAESAFAYVKQSRERQDNARSAATARGGAQARPATAAKPQGRSRSTQLKPAGSTDTGPRPILASLERATELANRGRLDDAKQLCERIIAEAGASPDAYCLLGVISNAAGNREDAVACFNKSLYLNQNHHETLVHLALLHEQRGEQAAAANFRRRAERARRGEAK
jgi:chemotaxis protein methyltransferase WspC